MTAIFVVRQIDLKITNLVEDVKGKSAYCLCASIAARLCDVSRDVSTMTSQRLGTRRAAVIFPAILVLLRRSNFIGVRFIEIADCLSESGESVTSYTCF